MTETAHRVACIPEIFEEILTAHRYPHSPSLRSASQSLLEWFDQKT